MESEQDETIYQEVVGGADLLRWFGRVPSFHDAEILSLDLRRKRQSRLRLHGWITTDKVGEDGFLVLEREAIVSLVFHEIMDLQLDGFSQQNVIGGLILRRAPDRPDRRCYLALDPLPQDIEIELQPCYGLDGLTRARSVSISLQPGAPNAKDV
ncbi:MAG: Imm50 family immunity protein [Methylorubrum populi]